jgi:hypothetical protein
MKIPAMAVALTLGFSAGAIARKQLKQVQMSDFSEKSFTNNINHFDTTPDDK